MSKDIKDIEITWMCNFHPTTGGWHQMGCPHQAWTKSELQEALESALKTIEYHFHVMRNDPELLAKFNVLKA